MGGFDLTDLANVDREVADGMATVFTFLAREDDLVHSDAYKPEIIQIIRRWRPNVEID
ncbi:hypothetical protein [Agrobacterium sp. V1]|uniref:DUF7673 family protein n=1 Tax=Agrobacterium sp. V1 TaxID=3061957 RepID=UPI00349FEAE6